MSVSSIDRNESKPHASTTESSTHPLQVPEMALPRYLAFKHALERVLAAVLLVPGIAIIGLLIAVVRMTSRGPGIYRQRRVGRGGRIFTMYKIRTMRVDAEQGTGAVWTKPLDDRITLVGRIFRKLHLDEFPQLFNVLRGDMSLIGPRPERPEFVAVLAKSVSGYAARLVVLPGITGLAQINLPPDTDLDSVRRKLVLDVEYATTASLWLDCRILLCTFVRLLGLPGAAAMQLCGVRRRAPLPAVQHDAAHAKDESVMPATPLNVAGQNGAKRHAAAHAEGAQPKSSKSKPR